MMGGRPKDPRSWRAAADKCGISYQALRNIKNKGGVPNYPNGEVDVDDVYDHYKDYLRARAAARDPQAFRADRLGAKEAATAGSSGQGRGGPGRLVLEHERARLAKANSDRAELQLERERGRLLPADEVVTGWQEAIGRARALLLGVPVTAGSELMIMATKHARDAGEVAPEFQVEARQLLTSLIDSALNELSDTTIDETDEEERGLERPAPKVFAPAEAKPLELGQETGVEEFLPDEPG